MRNDGMKDLDGDEFFLAAEDELIRVSKHQNNECSECQIDANKIFMVEGTTNEEFMQFVGNNDVVRFIINEHGLHEKSQIVSSCNFGRHSKCNDGQNDDYHGTIYELSKQQIHFHEQACENIQYFTCGEGSCSSDYTVENLSAFHRSDI